MTEALKVRHRKPRLGSRELYEGSQARPRPEYKDHVWNCAFVDAQTSDGEPFRMFTILDGYTLECLAIVVERRVSLEDIIDRLFDLFVLREVPKYVVVGGGSESVTKAVADWLSQLPVETILVEPGNPQQDGCAESFKEKLRVELIESGTFTTLPEARIQMGNWRRQYNEQRPQRSPLEDEPQAPQVTQMSSFIEGEASTTQTLQPTPAAVAPTGQGAQLLESGQHRDGRKTGVHKWLVKVVRVAEYVGIALVIVLMGAVVLALLAPRYGWRADTVLSGSMEPALPVGCVEVTRPVRLDTIEAGDIITFRSPTNGKLMSHRVVAVEEGDSYQFRTKGDANEDVDPYLIPAQNVVGRVWFRLSHVGYVVEYLKTPIGFILLGLCGIALILAEVSTMLEVRWKESAQADTEAK
jgi:signal peptidase I